jgi:inosine/guanosine/xanthosine phosphorylase family protein
MRHAINTANWLFNNGLDKSTTLSIAVVCGSGLAQACDNYLNRIASWNYSDIPDFPTTTVSGHGGELIVGELKSSGMKTLVFSGRKHLYEGIDSNELLFQVHLANALNIKTLILTCSVGSLNPRTGPGSLGLMLDQIDFQFSRFASRMDDSRMSLYPIFDRNLAESLKIAALHAKVALTEGIFCSVLGPTYETPAEVRMLRLMSCDWVSMSTTKEASEAKRLGMSVAGITGISNAMIAHYEGGETTHDEVLEASKKSSDNLWKMLSMLNEKNL